MTDQEITALAREYAEEEYSARHCVDIMTYEAENVIRFLLRRYALVKQDKAADLCRLALEHDYSVDYGLIDGLTDFVIEVFPEQYRQVANSPEIAKEVQQ